MLPSGSELGCATDMIFNMETVCCEVAGREPTKSRSSKPATDDQEDSVTRYLGASPSSAAGPLLW